MPWRPTFACLAFAAVFAFAPEGFAQTSARQRILAPGVLTVIPAEPTVEEAVTEPRKLVELVEGQAGLNWDPNYLPKSQTLLEMASRVSFRKPVHCLEFGFKPLRMIEVDVPQPSGRMQRKLVWYLVYRVRNPGRHLTSIQEVEANGKPKIETQYQNYPVRFFPQISLLAHEFDKEYLDQIIPAAIEPIRQREKMSGPLHNSVEISQYDLPVVGPGEDGGLWGVATWTDLDPRIDFLSIFVRGLTNAYRFEDPPGAYKPGDPPGSGRKFTWKTLQLNFWRPSDTEFEHEEEIRYGVPKYEDADRQRQAVELYGQQEPLDHRWVYR